MKQKILFALFGLVLSLHSNALAANVTKDYNYITAQALDSNYLSTAFTVEKLDKFSIHCAWTESSPTVAGTLKLQVSTNGTNYEDLAGMSVSVSGAGSQLFLVNAVSFRYVKVNYASSSGDGALTCDLHAVSTN